MTKTLTVAALALGVILAVPSGALAQDDDPGEHIEKGHYLFKTGYYLKASEHYRLALLDDPSSPWKKLAFGHALFAIGNYSYASYALRRGVAELDQDGTFQPEIATLFPSRRAFTQALRDLKRYVTYSPRDPAGLTSLGYVLYAVPGEDRRCRDMFRYLLRIDPHDPFAKFFLKLLNRRSKLPKAAQGDVIPLRPPVEAPPVEPVIEPPPAKVEPVKPIEAPPVKPLTPPAKPKATSTEFPPVKDYVPPPSRHTEKLKTEWPSPVPALAD